MRQNDTTAKLHEKCQLSYKRNAIAALQKSGQSDSFHMDCATFNLKDL